MSERDSGTGRTIYVCPVCGDWMGQRDAFAEDVVCGGPRGPHEEVDCLAVSTVPCDAEAVARVADELRSMLGDVPLDFRELAEMALRAAGEVSDPSSTTLDPASERLGPEAANHV